MTEQSPRRTNDKDYLIEIGGVGIVYVPFARDSFEAGIIALTSHIKPENNRGYRLKSLYK